MMKMNAFKLLLITIISITLTTSVLAQSDPLDNSMWYNEKKTAKIEIYKRADGKFYGKIVWLQEPDRDGKPKTDINNPDESKKNVPDIGLEVLKGFKKDGTHSYEDGTIYDPKNGKTYSSEMTLEGNTLHVRGYIGISLIGRTEVWTKVN